jgi:hypothetical protein
MQMKKRLSAALLVVFAACALAVSACGNLNELSGGPYVNNFTPIPTLAQTVVGTMVLESGGTGLAERPTSGPPVYNVMDTYTNTITKQ